MSFLGVCAGGMCRRTGRVQEREREREFSPLETPSLPPLPCPYRRTEKRASQHLLLHLPPSPLILAVSLSSPIDQSSNSSSSLWSGIGSLPQEFTGRRSTRIEGLSGS